MGSTSLLLLPPPSLPLVPPTGSLPALTASLRTHGYHVIQRDLGVEILPMLLDRSFGGNIFQCANDLLSAWEENCAEAAALARETRFGKSEFVSVCRVRDAIRDNAMPNLDEFKDAYDNKHLGTDYKTYRGIQDYYLGIFRLVNYVSRSPVKWFTEGPTREVRDLQSMILAELLADIDWFQITLLGLSLHPDSVETGLAIASMVRERYPHIHIAIGGDFTTLIDFKSQYDMEDVETLLRKYCDSIIYREGDTAIVRIMDCLTKGASWDEVPNLIRLKQDEVSRNQPFRCEDVKGLPVYDFDGLPIEQYPGLPVEVSRGCYWAKCSFCRWNLIRTNREMYPPKHPIYGFCPPDRLIESLKLYHDKYGKNTVDFTCLDVSPPQMGELCDAIIDAGLDVRWGARLRLDKTLTPDLFDKMAEAGAYYFHIHPETLTQRTADLHNKGYNIQHILGLIRYWEENADRLPPLFLNVFAGFPGETLEDFKETFEILRTGRFHMQWVHYWWLAKHSTLYNEPEKYGITIKERRGATPLRNYAWEADESVTREMNRIREFLQENQEIVKDRCRPLPHYTTPE